MKVKVLSRQEHDYTRERTNDVFRIHRNPAPLSHPFERAREYVRALNATKLERVQAKPFLGCLEPGHTDGVYALARHPHRLSTIASASADGHIRIWSLQKRKSFCFLENAHQGFIRGLCFADLQKEGINEPLTLLSAGEDRFVRLWKFDGLNDWQGDPLCGINEEVGKIGRSKYGISTKSNNSVTRCTEVSSNFETFRPQASLCMSYQGQDSFYAIDHHRTRPLFVTSASTVQVWDETRSEPLHTYRWGADTIQTVRLSPVETSIMAAAGSDRTLILYDIRMNGPLKKAILDAKTNSIAWNPMEAFHFSTASEDHQIYTFDMRYLGHGSLNIMKDHVSAVLDIDYSPTGQELVSGSYDKSIRIFKVGEGHSRDIYHTKRMQRVFCVKFTMDASYIVSGSDDANVRLWKAKSWQKLGPLNFRERSALNYAEQLKQKFRHLPEIRRVSRHRHVPKSIHSAAKLKRTMLAAEAHRTENERRHRKEGAIPYQRERHRHVIAVEK